MKRKSIATRDKKLSYNLAELSDATGLGEWSLIRAVQKKKLKAFKPTGNGRGTPLIFMAEDVDAFLMKGARE